MLLFLCIHIWIFFGAFSFEIDLFWIYFDFVTTAEHNTATMEKQRQKKTRWGKYGCHNIMEFKLNLFFVFPFISHLYCLQVCDSNMKKQTSHPATTSQTHATLHNATKVYFHTYSHKQTNGRKNGLLECQKKRRKKAHQFVWGTLAT